ncbi:MAG: 3-deoxy-manno-octulosonate cytidylyltransferase [Candidatus Omnitrophica bacterium]|nr:3-deoxy-manno-octulosonate cytidylyltransferase [Candidatus Omnitrophota bacterium]
MVIAGIIPARMASTRFPGKPLADICGVPLVGHVYFRSRMNKTLKYVYVATCDKEIEDYCLKNGIKVVMTKDTHTRASDRAAEAMLNIEREVGEKIDIVVMIQGDEPMLNPKMIDLAIRPMLEDSAILVVNLMVEIESAKEQEDANVVKVVVDKDNHALYFSREPIPSAKKVKGPVARYKQIPIIPFRRDSLIMFNNLAPKPLEIIESVDMLRLLEHGQKVKMVLSQFNTYGVDTPQDLKRVEKLIKADPLTARYWEGK